MARADVTVTHAELRTPLKLLAAASLTAILAVGLATPARAGDHPAADETVAAAESSQPAGHGGRGATAPDKAEQKGVSWGKRMKNQPPHKPRPPHP